MLATTPQHVLYMQHSTFVIIGDFEKYILPSSQHKVFQCTPLSQTDSHSAGEVYSWPPQLLVAYPSDSVKGTSTTTYIYNIYYIISILHVYIGMHAEQLWYVGRVVYQKNRRAWCTMFLVSVDRCTLKGQEGT